MKYSIENIMAQAGVIQLDLAPGMKRIAIQVLQSDLVICMSSGKENGSSHDVLYRKHASGSWGDIETLGNNVSSNDPLPVITASIPTHSLKIMVVYRGSNGLKYKQYSGSSWGSISSVNYTSSTSRNPSIAYKSNSYAYFEITWDDGDDVFHQHFWGSSWGSKTQVSWGALSEYNHQYSSLVMAGNNDQHVVWQSYDPSYYNSLVIFHVKNLNITQYSEFYNYWDYMRPTGSGHSGDDFTVLWYDEYDDIRKAEYYGNGWNQNVQGSKIKDDYIHPSISVANPPGATAKAIWRSKGSTAPFSLDLGPGGGLGKSSNNEVIAYHRRVVYSLGNNSNLSMQIGPIQVKSQANISYLDFPYVNDSDSLLSNQLAGKLTLNSINIPTNADTITFEVRLLSRNANNFKNTQNLPIKLGIEIFSNSNIKNSKKLYFNPIPDYDELIQKLNVAIPVQSFRNQTITLKPIFNNLDVDKIKGALVHIYGPIEGELQKQIAQEEIVTTHIVDSDFMSVYPNPFNPSTQISFILNKASDVSLRIYDLTGRLVKEWKKLELGTGKHQILWDGNHANGIPASSGTYFGELVVDEKRRIAKMTLIR